MLTLRKAFLSLPALVVLGGLVFWAVRAGGPARPSPAPAPAPGREPTSVVRGLDFADLDPDGTRCRIVAREGSGWEQEGTGDLKVMSAVLEKKGKIVHVDAGRALMQARTLLKLSEGVKVTWEEYEATLDRADYHRGEGRISSDAPVVLKGPGMSVRGTGIDVDVEKQTARIRSRVRAVLTGEKH